MPSLLVSALLLAGLQRDPVVPLRTPAEIARAIDAVGYPFASTNPSGTAGVIRRGESIVGLGMTLSYGPSGEREGSHVSLLVLTMEIDVPRETALADRIDGGVSTATRFVSHLGRTVTVVKRVEIGAETSREDLRAALDDYWRSGEAFARAHASRFAPALPRDRSTDHYPDGFVLDRADPISLRRATESWGWASRRSASVRVGGWIIPLAIAGRALWLRESPIESPGHDVGFFVGTVAQLPSPASSIERMKARFGDAELASLGNAAVRVERAIDLSRGLTLGVIRERIRSFVTDLETSLKAG